MNGIKQDPDVKSSGYMDDDFYEDTGELSLPPRGSEKDVWLTRIPKWLYQAVSNWDELADGADDDQIVLGEILALPNENRTGGLSKKEPMRLFMNDKWQSKAKQLPEAYELAPPNMDNKDTKTPQQIKAMEDMLASTYVFTEKDLPGYKPNGFGRFGQNNAGSSGSFGVQDPRAKVQKRSKYKKAIPKQTTLIGSATREYAANPLPTKKFVDFSKKRAHLAVQGANLKTNIVENMNDHTLAQAVQKKFQTFIKPAAPRKSQTNKAARIPKNELMDQLHDCFDRFMYWPMKALKAETRQPEAYLKEVLVDIAELVRSGTFASCWKRHSMYDKNTANQINGMALVENDGEDDEDDEEMEDVV